MRPSRRLDSLPVYAFASLDAKLQTLQAQGLDIIRLDIGSPDGPPTPLVIETLATSARNPGNMVIRGSWGCRRCGRPWRTITGDDSGWT